MPGQPLQPFAPPQGLSHFVPGGLVSSGLLLEWFLFAVFIFWLVYTLVAIYHWLKYSHASTVAFPAMAVHFIISIALISYTLSGSALWFGPLLP